MKKYHLKNRPNRELKTQEEINGILENGKYAIISMCRDNEPYVVTLSYGLDKETNSLYFHCSPVGLKMDFLAVNKKVCATIIEDSGYLMDECAHEYKSVVFWGEMYQIKNLDEKKRGMQVLLRHLEQKDSVVKEKMLKSDEYYPKMSILRLDIHQIHAKAGR